MTGTAYILLALLAIYFEKVRIPITSSIPWPSCFAFLPAALISVRLRRWGPIIIAWFGVCTFDLFNIIATAFGSVPALEKLKSAI